MTEAEIEARANELIREHRLEAHKYVVMRANEFLDKGDMDGVQTWRSILRRFFMLIGDRPEHLN